MLERERCLEADEALARKLELEEEQKSNNTHTSRVTKSARKPAKPTISDLLRAQPKSAPHKRVNLFNSSQGDERSLVTSNATSGLIQHTSPLAKSFARASASSSATPPAIASSSSSTTAAGSLSSIPSRAKVLGYCDVDLVAIEDTSDAVCDAGGKRSDRDRRAESSFESRIDNIISTRPIVRETLMKNRDVAQNSANSNSNALLSPAATGTTPHQTTPSAAATCSDDTTTTTATTSSPSRPSPTSSTASTSCRRVMDGKHQVQDTDIGRTSEVVIVCVDEDEEADRCESVGNEARTSTRTKPNVASPLSSVRSPDGLGTSNSSSNISRSSRSTKHRRRTNESTSSSSSSSLSSSKRRMSTWSCQACSFENDLRWLRCEICNNRR
jgi:hypothetical protein